MTRTRGLWLIAILIVLSVVALLSPHGVTQVATTLLPNGWNISGTDGVVKTLGTLPQGMVASPDGSRIAVVEAGFSPPALRVFDALSLQEIAHLPIDAAFGKPAWDRDGNGIWVSTGDENTIEHVHLSGLGQAIIDRTIQVAPAKSTFYTSSIARDVESGLLAVSGESANAVAIVDPVAGKVLKILHIDVPNAAISSHPAELTWAPDGSRLYVALWGRDGVAVLDPTQDRLIRTIQTGFHPESLALSGDGSTLYVANSDGDSVSAIDPSTLTVRQTLRIRIFSSSAYGLEPNDVFVDDKAHRLYVSLAGANAIAVIDTGGGTLKFAGAIPTGWYPTGSLVAAGMLVIADGKGEQSHANPSFDINAKPPKPGQYDHRADSNAGYIGDNLIGALRQIPIPTDDNLAQLTRQVERNAAPMDASAARPARPLDPEEIDGARIVRAGGPIHHVIYIIKENRTYDQVLGDERAGDGDPHLAVFGKGITPNEHAIAERFGLFDRTFTDSHVSEDGHQWITEGMANDILEKTWPPEYASRRAEVDTTAFETPDGYIWDDAKRAHETYRTYGEFTLPDPHHRGRYMPQIPVLAGHTDTRFPCFDLTISDQVRVSEWEREFHRYVAHGDLPRLETLWIMSDHTMGTRVGSLTPQAYVADNDLAIGRLVEDVSHSRYWKDTVIVMIEDDAQAGPDHVDDQRTTMYIASPYARGGLQHHHYTQTGLLRTIELILGLSPLSTFDAGADPLYAAFTTHPNFAPYETIPEKHNLHETNAATAYGATISAHLDFSRPDAVDPAILNRIIMYASPLNQATSE